VMDCAGFWVSSFDYSQYYDSNTAKVE